MILRKASAVVSVGLFLSLLLHSGELVAQSTEYLEEILTAEAAFVTAPYYVSKGRKIALVRSQRYGAFLLQNDSELSNFEDDVSNISSMTIEKISLLERYGITLVRRNDSASEDSFRENIEGLQNTYAPTPVYQSGNTDVILRNEFIVRFIDSVTVQQAEEMLASIGARDLETGRRSRNQYVIEVPERSLMQALILVNTLAERKQVVYARPNFVRMSPRRLSFREESPQSPKPILAMEPIVEYDWPNDIHFDGQWGLRQVNADEAWQSTTGGCNAKIAIVDSGVDLDHEDLSEKISQKFNILDVGSAPLPTDNDDKHGTNSAGVAAARTNNNQIGVAGVVWGGEIIVVRVFDGSLLSEVTTDLTLQTGIDTAVDAGATVISNGWGYWFETAGDDTAAAQPGKEDGLENVEEAMEDAIENNVVLVFAVGNTVKCDDNDPGCELHVLWPAKLSVDLPIIAVGATDDEDKLLGGSRYTPGEDEVTLVAPGAYIYTTNVTGASPGMYTKFFEKTSAATPMVAGAAALVLSWLPDADPGDVRDWLTQGAWKPPEGTENIHAFGMGRLDIGKTLEMIGTSGIDLAANLGSDDRLAYGETTEIEATVTRDGVSLSGASVIFRSVLPGLATVSPSNSYQATNCSGLAAGRVKGAAFLPFHVTTQIEVQAAGITRLVDVKVGGFGWFQWIVIFAILSILVSIRIRWANR